MLNDHVIILLTADTPKLGVVGSISDDYPHEYPTMIFNIQKNTPGISHSSLGKYPGFCPPRNFPTCHLHIPFELAHQCAHTGLVG